MRSSPLPRMSRRGRVTVGVLIGVFLFFTLLGWVVDAWTDWLWFDETNYTRVFTNVLTTRLLLFAVFGVLMALVTGGNLYLAYRLRPLLFPRSPEQHTLERYRMILTPRIGTWIALAAGVVGFFTGLSAQGHWTDWMLFRNVQSFGVKDPEFGVDVGFYVFEYPLWRYLLGVAMTATVLAVIGSLAVHYVYGAVRLTGAGDRMTNAARVHLTTLVAVFVLLKAVAYFLDRRGLLFGTVEIGGTDLNGAGYSAINALLPAKEILAYISIVVAIAIIVFSNAFMRNLVWPGISLALLVISAIAVGGIYPWAVQSFTVSPSVLEKERPYIQRSIEATRAAYGLIDTKVTSYPAHNLTPPASLATDTSIVPNIRLLDPAVVSDTYTQLQQVRGFYDFGKKLDIDRYAIDGRTQDYIVGVRELDPGKLVDAQRNWINRHTVFTHGYGLVAAPANRVGRDGQPCFISGLLGQESEQQAGTASCSSPTERIPTSQPRVYYGERLTGYAVVGKGSGGRNVEFDRPAGAAGDQYYTYQGTGGVQIGSYDRRLLYAAKYREVNFLLSDAVNDSSRLLYVRDPRSRVEKVAPFLTLDGDPYPAMVDGRIVWIVDGYTTASTYPYAQRINLQQATNDTLTNIGTFQLARQNINYIRNSVKATVDAYDGTVTLYAFDDSDPVLKAWNKAFGGDLIKPRDAMPRQLTEHLRYPADLFKVQRDLLAKFHVTDPNEFFSGQNFWEVPEDPAQQGVNKSKQPPYYLLTKLPGQADTRFQLTAAVTPTKRQNLAALISGSYLDNRPVLEVLELPPENRIPGPGQAQQSMENDATARSALSLLSSETSVVVKGNLLSLPFGGGMLYVEPIYLKSKVENPYPLMKKVLLNYGDRVAFADTLEAGIKQLVASAGQPTPVEPPPGAQPPSTGLPGDLASAAADVRKAIDDLRAAQQTGDFEQYGKALANLEVALKRFEEAQRKAGAGAGATPSATPPASPSPSG